MEVSTTLPKASEFLRSKGWEPVHPGEFPNGTDWRKGAQVLSFIDALRLEWNKEKEGEK
jgi:hypothetical protein